MTIPKLGIIFEYSGTWVHPNPRSADWDKWKHPFTKESAQVCYEKDRYKINLAINNGWIVKEIYSDEASKENFTECIKLIIDRINKIR